MNTDFNAVILAYLAKYAKLETLARPAKFISFPTNMRKLSEA
jgi:hypothetical protein